MPHGKSLKPEKGEVKVSIHSFSISQNEVPVMLVLAVIKTC